MAACACCAGVYKTAWFRRVVFFVLLIVNLGDMLADWLLYYSVLKQKRGLVYGPVPDYLVTAVLVFAILGTVLFPLEVVNSALKAFRDKCWVQIDVMSAFVLWLTDVPQTIVNVIIAACREEHVTDFQLVKGGVVIAGCAIRLIVVIVRYCSKKQLKSSKDDTPKTRCRLAARYLVIIAIKVSCIGSILVFIFSKFHVENGAVVLNSDGRHFGNVGIFVDQNAILPQANLSGSNWLKISSIHSAMETDRDLLVRIRVEKTSQRPRLAIFSNEDSRNLSVKICCRISLVPQLSVTDVLDASSCSNITRSNSHETIFRFHYERPTDFVLTSSNVFGDITFNEKRTFTNDTFPVVDGYGGYLRYFKYHVNSNASVPVYSEVDLVHIEEVWTNGYFRCEGSGSLVPSKDAALPLDGLGL